MPVLINYPLFHADDDNGAPLTGGLLYFYIAGTSTESTTYSDSALSVANTNPVVLDSRGDATIYSPSGLRKLLLKTSAGVTVWTQDNVQVGFGVDYDGTTTSIDSLTLATGATLTEFSIDGTLAGDSDTASPTEKAVKTYVDTLIALYSTTAVVDVLRKRDGRVGRSIFTYNGGSTAYTVKAKGAVYWCKDKLCHWDSELTTTAISTPVASTWYYLYLDYSAITEGTAVTAAELVWSSTAPTWSNTYSQWMSGDDRCIFAALANATPDNIYEFFHEGGDVTLFANHLESLAETDVDVTWTDVTLNIPAFCTKGLVTFHTAMGVGGDTYQIFYWRTNGQTASTGHYAGEAGQYTADQDRYFTDNQTTVIAEAATWKIEVKANASSAHLIGVYTDGWYFPAGM